MTAAPTVRPGQMPRVPTLTEVVDVPEGMGAMLVDAAPPPGVAAPSPAEPPARALTPLDEQQITQKVLADVQQRIDLMFEYRLREALAPALARLTDAVLRDARVELATTLRDVVARAVAQELSRHRQR